MKMSIPICVPLKENNGGHPFDRYSEKSVQVSQACLVQQEYQQVFRSLFLCQRDGVLPRFSCHFLLYSSKISAKESIVSTILRFAMLNFIHRLTFLLSLSLVFHDAWCAHAKKPNSLPIYSDRILGQDDAPITLYEYSSLTCPHCAAFHTDILPKLKEDFIDTGKMRFILRDFPLDPLSLAGAMMARCTPGNRYTRHGCSLFTARKTNWSRKPLKLSQTDRAVGRNDKRYT